MMTDFDLKSTFEAAGKESTEWSDQRGEWRECNTVDLKRVQVDSFLWTKKQTDIITNQHTQRVTKMFQMIQKCSFAKILPSSKTMTILLRVLNTIKAQMAWFILTHLITFCTTPGRVYSCITNRLEGSHSTAKRFVSLLYSTGHTKYWYWDSRYANWNKRRARSFLSVFNNAVLNGLH